MQDQEPPAVSSAFLHLQAFGPLIYAVPSILIYIAVIAVLLGRFKEPFYRLFAVNGIIVSTVDAKSRPQMLLRNASHGYFLSLSPGPATAASSTLFSRPYLRVVR